jgi:hypothetical protein
VSVYEVSDNQREPAAATLRTAATTAISDARTLGQLADILAAVESFMRRFLATLHGAHFAVLALYVAHTYAIGAAESTVYIHTTSAEVESGKTRMLEVLELLAFRAVMLLDPSAASLYRGIDSGQMVTLLIDEVDTYLPGGKADSDTKKTIVGLLNSGYRRGGKVPRVRDRSGELEWFDLFSPKVLTGLAPLPQTLASRSLLFVMRRRRREEIVERLRLRAAREDAQPIVNALEDWATPTVIDQLREMRPELPSELSDRLQDACEPLVAIADLADGEWPQRIREALVALASDARDAEAAESRGTQLLADIRDAFDAFGPTVSGSALLDHLNTLEERGWGGWNEGQGLRPRNLAALLKPFALRSKDIHLYPDRERRTLKGFEQTQFEDAFARYLPAREQPPLTAASAPSAPHPENARSTPDSDPRHDPEMAPFAEPQSWLEHADGADGAHAAADQEWLARDGSWRSLTHDPPLFPGEVIDTRYGNSPEPQGDDQPIALHVPGRER